jgi:hypothetical protein
MVIRSTQPGVVKMKHTPWIVLLLTTTLVGCASNISKDTQANDTGGSPSADADTDSDTDIDTDADSDSDTFSDSDTDTVCTEVSETPSALEPVDIIIAVDNSGSMNEEAGFVQEHLNGFSAQIVDSGVDAHIVLITAPSWDSNGICIDPPLGSGDCPDDTNLPGYLHVPEPVSSHNSLGQIHSTYDSWESSLRVGSHRHVLVISDDNSSYSAIWFLDSMAALDPPFVDFRFHAIVSKMDPDPACAMDPPHPCCEYSASYGFIYHWLTLGTDGLMSDLCDQNFEPVFDVLAILVGDVGIACQWEIPDPPDDEALDPDKVNLEYTDAADVTTVVGRVDDPSACDEVIHGWYYDDPLDPTMIHLCPQTCDWIQQDPDGQIVIQFGCDTVEAVE